MPDHEAIHYEAEQDARFTKIRTEFDAILYYDPVGVMDEMQDLGWIYGYNYELHLIRTERGEPMVELQDYCDELDCDEMQIIIERYKN